MIPSFSSSGVLPPFITEDPSEPNSMSPYQVGLVEFVTHFGTTPERKLLLRGLLNYRLKMKNVGFTDGIQWIDGSFVENIEKIQGRPPADVDLVTFSAIPTSITCENEWDLFFDENRSLFDNTLSKKEFYCDAFYVNIHTNPLYLIQQVRYWFGLFTHQRSTSLWKGIIELNLAEDESDALKLVTEEEINNAS